MKKSYKKGFALIEIMLACGIITLALLAAITVATKALQVSRLTLRESQASFLLEEGAEALKGIRDSGWANISALSSNTTYYLTCASCSGTSATWSATASAPAAIDNVFTRSFVLSLVYRDANDNITSTVGQQADTSTKKVTETVTWSDGGTNYTKTLTFYLTNVFY